MAKEICISSTPHETRLAILEDDQLAEIYYERENEYTLAGSIYNGRVTRVLPGMQSAFVDIGLERDAFLYVTDFLELEDQEETDELEKAAAAGGNQPPREVRHSGAQERRTGRSHPQEPRQEQRPERASLDRHAAVEPAAEPLEAEEVASLPGFVAEPSEGAPEEAGDSNSRRWRGRRRRRGSRGTGSRESQPDAAEASEDSIASESERQTAPAIQAEAGVAPYKEKFVPPAGEAPAPRRPEPASAAFILPGESLSKYGGAPAESLRPAEPEIPPPARAASTFKPSTLIESPLVWDGSGVLPGESLSRHRRQESAGAEPEIAPQSLRAAEQIAVEGADAMEEEELVEVMTEASAAPASAVQAAREEEQSDESAWEGPASAGSEAAEAESDASASHRIDPSAPASFRIFGFGKKKNEAGERPAPAPAASNYNPGSGLIAEEVIEGEEVEATHHYRGEDEEHDLDVYEEETVPNQLRSGDLGEMFQEAHLDHRIQLNFDSVNEEEEREEEEEISAGKPAATAGSVRRERGGRGGRRSRETAGAPSASGRGRGPSRRTMQTNDLPVISDLLKPGQEILVQIAKEPIAKKGARITSHIALPGRFLVFMPTVSHVGVSRKIASDEERQRLKRILVHERGEASGGFIVRTAAEGASEEELRSDLRFLLNLWSEIKQRSDSSKSPSLIYHDLSLIERILRDQVSSDFSNIWVDSEGDYERIVRFLNRFSPSLVRRVKLYTKETPLFEHFGIEDEISKALRSKVWLKSGGSIVINQTEALVAIDINTGKYVGKSARLEDTIVKTNLDAVPEIVRQIRLRDLGGIIVIDFIDMDERKNRFKVLAALEEALKSDRAPTKVLQFNDFGLVAITRKRVKQSLERTLSVPCPTCQATGMVKSPATVCNEVYVELRKMKKHFENDDVLLRVHPETVKVLKSNNARWLVEFEELTGRNILVKSDPALHPEQFDIQG